MLHSACVATAPAPTAAAGTARPTARTLEATATPSHCPSALTAAIEKVTARLLAQPHVGWVELRQVWHVDHVVHQRGVEADELRRGNRVHRHVLQDRLVGRGPVLVGRGLADRGLALLDQLVDGRVAEEAEVAGLGRERGAIE